MDRTFLMVIAYDGTDFHGFQTQPGQRTVQEVIENQLQRVLRHPVELIGSGRTDSGVHARGMATSFTTSRDLPEEKLIHAIGGRLPTDLAIVSLRRMRPDFNARFDAISKYYRYRVWNDALRPVAGLCQRYVYHCWRTLDLGSIQSAARYFVGRHDFQAMAGAGCQRKTTIREVTRCEVTLGGVETMPAGRELHFHVEGAGFLYKQVRNMVGTLLDIGQGRRPPEEVAKILESRDRRQAGPTAPAQGLTLMEVLYPQEVFSVPPDHDPAPPHLPTEPRS